MAQDWPVLGVSVAFAGNPNDTTSTVTWTDISSRVLAMKYKQGREYELSATEAGEMTMTLNNDDDALDPNNSASPYYPNVVPYRRVRVVAQYGTGNILNDQNSAHPWAPVKWSDGTFEAALSGHWTTYGTSVAPTIAISTADKHDGTSSLLVTCGANALNAFGIANEALLSVPTIPGQQYTFSVWVKAVALPASGTVGLIVNSVGYGPATTTVGSWVQLSQTFTAIDHVSSVAVITGGAATTAAHSFYVDSVQVVPGAVGGTYRHIWLTDGGMRSGTLTDWTATNAVITENLTVGYNGNTSMMITPTGAVTLTSSAVTVAAGQSVAVQVRMLETLANVSAQVTLNWKTGAGAAISSTSGASTVMGTSDWTLVTATGTAPATTGQVVVTVTFTGGTSTAYMTAAMVEVGAASVGSYADTYTGTLMQPLFSGYVERWPMKWEEQGFRSRSEVVCVDALGLLGLTKLRPAVIMDHQQDAGFNGYWFTLVASYWPLIDSTSPAQAAGTVVGSQYGNSTAQLALQWTGAGGVVDTAPLVTGTDNYDALSGLRFTATTTAVGSYAQATLEGLQVPSGYGGGTFEFAFRTAATGCVLGRWVGVGYKPSNLKYQFAAYLDGTGKLVLIWYDGTGTANTYTSAAAFNNSVTHHVACTLSSTGTGYTVTVYADGASVQTWTLTDSTYGGYFPLMPNVFLCGPVVGATYLFSTTGITVGQVAVYPYVLSATRIASHYATINGTWSGDYSGARINRLLGWAYYNGLSNVQTGSSRMIGAGGLAGASMSDALQNVADTENGLLYCDGGGRITFLGRASRFTAANAMVFGERETLGEVPYQGDITLDYDPQKVYNECEFTRAGNANGGTTVVSDITSIKKYFLRVLQRTLSVYTNAENTSAANWFLNRYKDPHLRVSTLDVDMATLGKWQRLLAINVGTKVQLKRRVQTGDTIVLDAFVEHVEVTIDPAKWEMNVQLSPAWFSSGWVMGNSAVSDSLPAGTAASLHPPANQNSIIGQTTTVAY